MAKKSEWSRAVATLNRIVFDGGQHFHDLTGPAVESCQEATQWEVALHLWQMFPSMAAGHCLLLALHQASLEFCFQYLYGDVSENFRGFYLKNSFMFMQHGVKQGTDPVGRLASPINLAGC